MLLTLLIFFLLFDMQNLTAEVSAAYKGTFGTSNYVGNNIDLYSKFPSGYNLDLNYNSYSSDLSTGITQTYYGNFGWFGQKASWNINGSMTPEVNSYRNYGFGFGGSWKVLSAGSPDENGNAPVEANLSLGYGRINHVDGTTTLSQIVRTGRTFQTQTLTTDNKIGENDFKFGLTMGLYQTFLSLKFVKSTYDQSSLQTFRRAIRVLANPVFQQGYANQTFTAEVGQDFSSWLTVYGIYENIQYKFGETGIADSYTAGADLTWKIFEFTTEYNLTIPSSGSQFNGASIGVSVKFGPAGNPSETKEIKED